VLALTNVNPEYEIRVGEARGTVADLVRAEQLHVQSGNDLSHTLIGLAKYLPDDAGWQNDLGESWSLDRMVEEELGRETDVSRAEFVYRLMGLSAAVDARRRRDEPLTGQFARAAEYVDALHAHALKLQNADGSWNPGFFAYRGPSSDTVGTLRSTGHLLEWLATSLPEERLHDPQVVKAVAKVNALLAGQSSRLYVYTMSAGNIETWNHALHALVVYNRRALKPFDPPEPEPHEDEVASARR